MRLVLPILAAIAALAAVARLSPVPRPVVCYLVAMIADRVMTHAAALALPVDNRGYAWIYVYPVVIILWCVLWIARPWRWRGLLVLVPTVAAYLLAKRGWGEIPPQIVLAIAQGAVLGFAAMALSFTRQLPRGAQGAWKGALGALWLFQSLYFFLYAIDVHRHYDLWVYGLNKWVPMAAVTIGFAYLAYRLRYARS